MWQLVVERSLYIRLIAYNDTSLCLCDTRDKFVYGGTTFFSDTFRLTVIDQVTN